MPINVNDPEYIKAEKDFHEAKDLEEQLMALNKMISHAPSHKGAENLRQQLTTRRKKIEAQLEKKQKSKSSSKKQGIRKEEMQASIVGKTNTGKSSLLKKLTNSEPEIASYDFTTKEPSVAMMDFSGCNIQLVEIPAFESEYYEKSIPYNSDTVLIIVTSLEDIKEILDDLKTQGKIILVFNKIDFIQEKEKRKIRETLKSKYRDYNFQLISTETEEGIKELKEKIFKSFDKIRVYTKEPGKALNKVDKKPMILEPKSTLKDVAEKILKGFSKRVKEARITGPSGKFPNQKVGLKHQVKDLDIVEFRTK